MGKCVVFGSWRGKRLGLLAGAVLLGLVQTSAGAGETVRGSDWQPLSAALAALGTPDARRAASAIVVEQRGASYPVEQARDPARPTGEAARFYRWRFDTRRQRLVREAEQLFPGGIRFWSRAALAPGGGWNVDLIRWRAGTDLQTITDADARETRLGWERFLPHLLLEQAASGDLEPTGPAAFRYTDASGAKVDVELDPATLLPRRAAHGGGGAPRQELVYEDYARR